MGTTKEISGLTIVIGALTDAGRSGKNNEDNFVVFESQFGSKEGTTGWSTAQVLMVADGIGGNVAGEMASQMAVATFREAFLYAQSSSLSQRLVEALESANNAIYQKTLEQSNLQGMGTTVVAAALLRERLYVAHAGDSRAYLIRKGKAYQLTLDHTWAQEAIEAGRLTAAQAREHPNRHVIKRYVGIAPTVEIDPMLVDINRGPLDPDQIQSWPKTDHLDLQPDDTLLLCSDGLTDVVNDKEIEQTVTRHQPQNAARKLIDLANKAGGPDNITVLVLQRRQPGAPAAKAGGRSPVMATILGAVLIIMVMATWVLLANRGNGSSAEATATSVIGATVMPAAVLESTTEAPTATLLLSTATSSATPSPSPSASATVIQPATDSVAGSQTIVAALVNQKTVSGTTNMVSIADGTPFTTTPTVTAIPNSIGTRPSTPTPVQDPPTPTATLTPTPTPTASRIPEIGKSQALPPAALARGIPTNAQVVLQQPAAGDTFNSKSQFIWTANFILPQGYAFEPVFWTKEQSAMQGLGYGGFTDKSEMSLGPENFSTPGEYLWAVLLVQLSPYNRVKNLSEERPIIVEFPSSFAGSSSGDQGK